MTKNHFVDKKRQIILEDLHRIKKAGQTINNQGLWMYRIKSWLKICQPIDTQVGICHNMSNPNNFSIVLRSELEHILSKILVGWEYYSGTPVYPVRHDQISEPGAAFHKSVKNGVAGLWKGEYGRRRLELVDILIKYVEDSINGDG